MVDPLDGTKDFIRGRDGFAVMIGLLDGDRPALGVVYQPIGDKLYCATRGDGAFVAARRRRGRAHARERRARRRRRSAWSRRSRIARETIDRVRAELGISDELNVGSVGLKLGLIAEGVRDLYVNPAGHSKLWDACGPEAILVEAGGRLTDVRGAPLAYRGRELGNVRGLIASNGVLHDEVVRAAGGAVSRRRRAWVTAVIASRCWCCSTKRRRPSRCSAGPSCAGRWRTRCIAASSAGCRSSARRWPRCCPTGRRCDASSRASCATASPSRRAGIASSSTPRAPARCAEAYFDFVCQPLRHGGVVDGVLTFAVDVTSGRGARKRLESIGGGAAPRGRGARRVPLGRVARAQDAADGAAAAGAVAAALGGARARCASYSPEQLRARFDAAERQVQRLVQLIDALLDVSRLQGGALDLDVGEVDLVPLDRRGGRSRARRRVSANGSTLTLESVPSVRGRFDRFARRSDRHQPVGERDQVRARQADRGARRRRGRRGPGRASSASPTRASASRPTDHGRIFERFERAVSRTHYGGLGLGLWISRQIAESLGGTLTVESDVGKGARFTLHLPL